MRRQFVKAVIALAFSAAAQADITDKTLTIPIGQQVDLEAGTVVASGGDLKWDGTSLSPQGSARVVGLGSGDAQYQATTLAELQVLQTIGLLQPGAVYAIGALANQPLAAALTNGGHFAKIEDTSSTPVLNQPLTIKFTTYGATASGGGPSAPTISGIANNYGSITQGLPNYGIAPGALFVVAGSGLASAPTSLQSSAAPGLQTILNNVRVTASVGGTTMDCPLYYLSPTQIDAVLPGKIPPGTGTLVVTNNGVASAPATLVVLQSAFGILSYNGTLAATYDANNALVTATNAANPGQTIVIYGSGVGADANNDDKVYPQNLNNLTGIPLQAFVGGVQATVLYRGRSQFPGVDQINITLPSSGIPTGCFVSLAVVSGTTPISSNGATIPVAASGKTCSDPSSIFTPTLSQTLSGQSTVRIGILTASQATQIGGGGSNPLINVLSGIFERVTGTQYASAAGGNMISIGSCVVKSPSFTGFNSTATSLDAGPTINVTGPQGSIGLTQLSIPTQTLKLYGATSVPANFIPASGGPFTFDNASGGADVGHFNTTTNFPANFAWTNASVVTVVNRSQGVTVTWSGGAPGAYVTINGNSTSSGVGSPSVSASFTCQAPLSAGTFTVPTPVLLSLPAGQGKLSLIDNTAPQSFTATGLDVGYQFSMSEFDENVQYN